MSASVNLLHGICNTHQNKSKPATDKRGELIAERSSKADAETITLRVTTGGIFSTLLNSIPSFFSFCCAFFVVKPTSLSSCSCISSSCHKSQTSCDRSPKTFNTKNPWGSQGFRYTNSTRWKESLKTSKEQTELYHHHRLPIVEVWNWNMKVEFEPFLTCA